MMIRGFSGSYRDDQVQLLLEPIQMDYTGVEEKEQLIQTGQKHYSEMISREAAPSALHQQIFQQAVADGLPRLAHDIQALALAIAARQADPIVLVSLVRAGLPIGVMLTDALRDLGRAVQHYGISIILDRGLDAVAYAEIRQHFAYAQLVFVDGWTGKGAISRELHKDLQRDPEFDGVVRLLTLADISGYAWLTASAEDWLIPSGILGAPVSGLISRSIFQTEQRHGCVMYDELAGLDQSQQLIEQVNQQRRQPRQPRQQPIRAADWSDAQRLGQRQQAQQTIQAIAQRFAIDNPNRIKPSIAEATRAVMRRVPERILLQRADEPETALLRHLAELCGAPVEILGDAIAPYRAITIIQRRGA